MVRQTRNRNYNNHNNEPHRRRHHRIKNNSKHDDFVSWLSTAIWNTRKCVTFIIIIIIIIKVESIDSCLACRTYWTIDICIVTPICGQRYRLACFNLMLLSVRCVVLGWTESIMFREILVLHDFAMERSRSLCFCLQKWNAFKILRAMMIRWLHSIGWFPFLENNCHIPLSLFHDYFSVTFLLLVTVHLSLSHAQSRK